MATTLKHMVNCTGVAIKCINNNTVHSVTYFFCKCLFTGFFNHIKLHETIKISHPNGMSKTAGWAFLKHINLVLLEQLLTLRTFL